LYFLSIGNKRGLFRKDNHPTSIATAFRPWTKARNFRKDNHPTLIATAFRPWTRATNKGFSQNKSKTPKFMA